MPTFCRHNRFLERCPICSKTLAEHEPGRRPRATGGRDGSRASGHSRRRSPGAAGMRVRHEGRAGDDGYRSELLPGLRASSDAARLAEEIAFAGGRLLAMAAAPPGLYGEVRELAGSDLEQATWTCFLIAYLSPLAGEDPFSGIREALGALPGPRSAGWPDGPQDEDPAKQGAEESLELAGIPLGPHTSHDPARGAETLLAYRRWLAHGERGRAGGSEDDGQQAPAGGAQARAFRGDPAWTPPRRFERLFERLALPGLARMGRYDLLVTLGRLGLYELTGDSLHLAGVREPAANDRTTAAAKRLFAIGDPLNLERRAAALAEAVEVPVETLDLALANWAAPERATLGFPPQTSDDGALARARGALGL